MVLNFNCEKLLDYYCLSCRLIIIGYEYDYYFENHFFFFHIFDLLVIVVNCFLINLSLCTTREDLRNLFCYATIYWTDVNM